MAQALPTGSCLDKDDIASKAVASALADSWIDGLGGDGLVLHEGAAQFTRVPNSNVYKYERSGADSEKPDVFIHMVFDQPLEAGMTLEQVRASFKRIALDRLPTPGLGLEKVWSVRPQTPSSSFSEGVVITSFDSGAMTVKIDTSCFAVYGERKGRAEVMADAPMPADDFFQVRKAFKLQLTVEATFG